MVFDIRRFDIYRKVPKDLTQPTLTGAVISVGCVLFIVFLLLSELHRFLTVDVTSELFVDDPEKSGKIPVFLNISVPNLGCDYVGLDIQDDMGRHEVGFSENTLKIPIEETGCRYEGHFLVNKVPGNFHLSTHSAQQQPTQPNMQHIVHALRFGEDMKQRSAHGSFNPMFQKEMLAGDASLSHDYIIKIVPSVYQDLSGEQTFSYQYTFAHKEYVSFSHTGMVIPAVWFRYDLSPITVKYSERRLPLYSFLTTICAIVGGTFTVAGIIDSCVFTAGEFYKKFEMGKLS